MADKLKLLSIGLITGIINGLLGAGGGTLVVLALVFLLGIEDHKAHATAISIILPITLVSAFVYWENKVVNIPLTINIAIGSTLGGIIGAYFLNKLSIPLLRKIFGIILIIAAIRMWI
ncbi:MAG TPA: sulfite exporter TauE/SafE family protein [Clostridia bacterium]|nr:sulfite exporter TauE/SafE family protein [Clostridia bacterium]